MGPLLFALFLLEPSVPCGGRPSCVLSARVKSTRLPLLVDTGADLTVLSESAASRAGIRVDSNSPQIPIKGVTGNSWAYLARARIKIGEYDEPEVLIAVMKNLQVGKGAKGLLGMTFLERFRYGLDGRSLNLLPIDEKEDKSRGRGRSWWRRRFRSNAKRLRYYQRLVGSARKWDKSVETRFGEAADGRNATYYAKKLRDFMEEGAESLKMEAARRSVPLDWRR